MYISALGSVAAACVGVCGVVLSGLAVAYGPRAVAALEARTGIALTQQQRETMLGAVQTAAGIVGSYLDRGVLKLGDVHELSPAIRTQANAAIGAVPDTAQALGMTVDAVARMIVSRVRAGNGPAAPLPPLELPAAVVSPIAAALAVATQDALAVQAAAAPNKPAIPAIFTPPGFPGPDA